MLQRMASLACCSPRISEARCIATSQTPWDGATGRGSSGVPARTGKRCSEVNMQIASAAWEGQAASERSFACLKAKSPHAVVAVPQHARTICVCGMSLEIFAAAHVERIVALRGRHSPDEAARERACLGARSRVQRGPDALECVSGSAFWVAASGFAFLPAQASRAGPSPWVLAAAVRKREGAMQRVRSRLDRCTTTENTLTFLLFL